ncbi:n-acetylmuramoyl-L-alanine amidase [Clostridium sp. CAG:299]|nr:n-acetylmuramoyl-L-alanine amidase [Clostridium sp. CAG:299]
MVQTGAYRLRSLAEQQLAELQSQGYPAFLVYDNGYYDVRAGAFLNLDYAAALEEELRSRGYNTFIVKDYSTEDKKKLE